MADIADESLDKLLSGFGFDKLAFAGDLDLAVRLETARPEHFDIEGTAGVRDGLVKTSYSPVVLQDLNADVTLASDTATVSNLATTVLLPAGKRSPENPVSLTLHGQITGLKSPTVAQSAELENITGLLAGPGCSDPVGTVWRRTESRQGRLAGRWYP